MISQDFLAEEGKKSASETLSSLREEREKKQNELEDVRSTQTQQKRQKTNPDLKSENANVPIPKFLDLYEKLYISLQHIRVSMD